MHFGICAVKRNLQKETIYLNIVLGCWKLEASRYRALNMVISWEILSPYLPPTHSLVTPKNRIVRVIIVASNSK